MPEVVTLGETLAVLKAVAVGPMRYSNLYERRTGGAETNVAAGVVRLGHSAGWISRLGDDEFGLHILQMMRGEGIDVSRVHLDPAAQTGVFFRENREGSDPRNFYYRGGSAASRMAPADLDPDYIRSARVLHVTGITPALSDSCRDTVLEAMKMAREAGVTVTFDPNLRLKLWPLEVARPVLLEMARHSDVILPGISEAEALVGTSDPATAIQRLHELGPHTVVVKLGKAGAVASGPEGQAAVKPHEVHEIDPYGAGDSFAAGFIAGMLKGYSLAESLSLANACGALKVTAPGNIEALPTLEEVQRFLSKRGTIAR